MDKEIFNKPESVLAKLDTEVETGVPYDPNNHEEGPQCAIDKSAPGPEDFKEIVSGMFETFVKKNHDYGNSFHDLFVEFGPIVSVIHLKEKLNRIDSLVRGEKAYVTESIKDSLLDLANYAVLTLMELRI